LKDFSVLQKKISAVDPKGVTMDSYNPTAKAMDCPTVNSTWQANSTLPPTPNTSACDCMFKAASCVPASNLDASAYGDIFGYICGSDNSLCTGIQGNTTTGKYGTFSMCASQQKLAFVLDAYYKKSGNAASSCDFKGQAKVQTASGQTGCSKLTTSNGNTTSSGDKGNFAVTGAPLPRVAGSSVGLYLVAALFGATMVAW
jgi:hypothetical protein